MTDFLEADEEKETRRCASPEYVTLFVGIVLMGLGGFCLFVAWVLECP